MKHTWRALELKAEVDEQGRLSLDMPLPIKGPRQVKLVVLLPEETDEPGYEEEHGEGGMSAQLVDQNLTFWHDFRIARAEYTKLITLGVFEETSPKKPAQ